MKTLYLTLFTFVVLSTVSAQHHAFRLGIKGGLDLPYLTLGQPDLHNKLLPGINAGITATYGLGQHFSLQSGLSFSMKGGKVSGKGPMGFASMVYPGKDATLKSSQWYLQLPLYAQYRIKLSPDKGLVISAGPYIAQGIGGITSINGTLFYGDMIVQEELKEKTFISRGLKKFDYGIGGGIGLDLGECILGLNYEWGLRNVGPRKVTYLPFYNSTYKNRNLSLTVDFRL